MPVRKHAAHCGVRGRLCALCVAAAASAAARTKLRGSKREVACLGAAIARGISTTPFCGESAALAAMRIASLSSESVPHPALHHMHIEFLGTCPGRKMMCRHLSTPSHLVQLHLQ
jgi:hypothetical protein